MIVTCFISRRKIGQLFIILLILSVSSLSAQEIDRYEKSGLGIQIGTGILYGGLGGLVEYQILVNDNIRLTPLLGLGFSLGGTDTIFAYYYWLNSVIGINLEFGKKHRLLLGPQIFFAKDLYNKPSNAVIDKENLVAPSFIIGYKGTASFGLIWQLALGIAYVQNPLIRDKSYFFEPHINLGIGYKF